jgi:hypothetical protein
MPQGQQEKRYVMNFTMQGAKLLLFGQLQIGHEWKMVA